jgi:hypothetical protein
MSFGYYDFGHDPGGDGDYGERPALGAAFDSERVPVARLELQRAFEALPQLGTVLWLHRTSRDRAFPRARLTPRGVLLFEHPALGGLADCVAVNAFCAVTPQGPREWLEFDDAQGEAVARLYLLPDTDYLTWDVMLSGCAVTAVPAPERGWRTPVAFVRDAFARRASAWQARVVRLPLLRLIGLNVLGLRTPEPVSALGARVARDLAEEARAELLDA